jgi:hypothetical protein
MRGRVQCDASTVAGEGQPRVAASTSTLRKCPKTHSIRRRQLSAPAISGCQQCTASAHLATHGPYTIKCIIVSEGA